MKKFLIYMKVLKHLLKHIFKNHKLNYILLLVTSTLMAITFVLRANVEKSFFNSAFNFYKDASLANKNNILIYFIFFVIVYILTQFIVQLSNYIEEILQFKLEKRLSLQLCDKTANIPPEYFEDALFLDKLDKAMNGKDDAINILICTTALLSYYLPYIVFMSFWLWSQSILLVFVIIIAFIPTIISYSTQIKMYSQYEDDVAQLRRKEKAYEENMIGKTQAKETRFLGGYRFFMAQFREVLNTIFYFDIGVLKKRQKMNFYLKALQSLAFVSIIIISIYLTVKEKISIGTFAALFTSVDIMISNLNEAVSRQYASISESFGTVENYYGYLEEDFGIYGNGHEGALVRLENVSFKYPNNSFESLKDINLDIKPGERVAIVGENGAGKSTLTKLLLGIYRPTNGVVHTTPNEDYRYTAVFQNYMKYAMTIKDNVLLSLQGAPTKPSHLHEVLLKSGLDLSKEKFTLGVDTALGKEFGGMELSGGEWQKLAIARGMYDDFDFIVFDEPTASIDPIEESNINHVIHELTKGKTSFVVTHRMSTVKLADRILVLKEGEIVEDGSHEALTHLKGEYFRLYESQRNNYC